MGSRRHGRRGGGVQRRSASASQSWCRRCGYDARRTSILWPMLSNHRQADEDQLHAAHLHASSRNSISSCT